MDFSENTNISRKSLSRDDQMCMNKASKGNHHRSDGQYEFPQPFNKYNLKLHNNKITSRPSAQKFKIKIG